MPSPANPFRPAFLITLIIILAPGFTFAEDVYVQRPSLTVYAGKGPVYPAVGQPFKKGDKLTIIAHEGKWLKVQVGDQTGYVFEEAISVQPIAADNDKLGKAIGGSEASRMTSSAGGKAFGEAQAYAKSRNLDPTVLKRMLASRAAITPQVWIDFARQGHVGPEKNSAPSANTPADGWGKESQPHN